MIGGFTRRTETADVPRCNISDQLPPPFIPHPFRARMPLQAMAVSIESARGIEKRSTQLRPKMLINLLNLHSAKSLN